MKKINRLNVGEHLLEYQFDLIGKTKMDAIMDDEWITKWSLTQEQYDQFRVYAVALLKKVFKCNTNRAKNTFEWFDMQFGLRVV
jgi:hypothetical protein